MKIYKKIGFEINVIKTGSVAARNFGPITLLFEDSLDLLDVVSLDQYLTILG